MDGFININKPRNFTSHDVLNVLKRSFPGVKIGHGGTLDPGATGVLPICLGKGTKLQDYVMGGKKTYVAEIQFGYDSPTLDKDGDYFVYDAEFYLEQHKLSQALTELQGAIEQVPPMVSAIKKDGVPLYKLARKGQKVELATREVTIYAIEVLDLQPAAPFPWVKLEITCSKGTYIRSLARDLGLALGTKAVVSALCRTAAGAFSLPDSYTIEEVAALTAAGDYSFLLPLESMLPEMAAVTTKDMAEVMSAIRGNHLTSSLPLAIGETVKICDFSGRLLALGKAEAADMVKPKKILYAPRNRRKPLEVWHSDAEVTNIRQNTAVALGNFDGVHLGHKYLLERLALEADQSNLQSVALTFAPHPREYFNIGDHRYLQTKSAKANHIAKTGVDALWFMKFDDSIANMTAADFVDTILVSVLKAQMVYVGYNFKFGCCPQADSAWLREYCAHKGIKVEILAKITYSGSEISSSAIRKKLRMGDIRGANTLLGYNFSLLGPVVTGQQLGRTIGFPTANVDFSPTVLLPAPGIYTTWATYRGQRHPAVTNVGYRPTVGQYPEPTVEVHILDDNPNVYGEEMAVEFLNRIRGEEKFPDLNALKVKIAEDADKARAFFHHRGKM